MHKLKHFASPLVGQIRQRRYRPFRVVPRKSPSASASAETPGEITSPASAASQSSLPAEEDLLCRVGPLEAMRLLQAFSPLPGFSLSKPTTPYITLSMTLDIDTRRQSVRGVCQLPHGLKTDSKLLVFCSDFDAQEMIQAGADFAGMNELLQRIGKGWTGFDRCLATPAVMPQVMKVAKILGPKKLMPNPKSGTLVTDLKRAILESKSGAQIEYRTRENLPIVDVNIGSLDAPSVANLENIKFIVKEILKHKSRQAAGGGADEENSAGRLVTVGGISLIPNAEKLAKLLNQKRTKSVTATNLFIQSACLKIMGHEIPEIILDPSKILPSSPAYYR